LGEFAGGYSLMNAQVTKVFSKKFEVYVGGENLTNFRQKNPVLSAENPFGPNFDTSIVYAPIMGRMFYRQKNPVLSAENPFGPNFDTSIVYAPIMGRMFYGGFRYKL